MNCLLKFCDNKKSLVAIILLMTVVTVFLFLSLFPSKSNAATDRGDFIRIKLDPGNKDFWEFFAPPNGQDGEFDVTVSSWTWLAQPYECALLLTEDIPFAADDEGIYWVADGKILSTTTGSSLSNDLGAPGANWKMCTDPTLSACKKDGAGIDFVPAVFHAPYSVGWDDECSGSECILSDSDTYYVPDVEILCEDTWMTCGAAEASCNTYNSKLYACNSGFWDLCTGTATPDCVAGGCVLLATCDTDPTIQITPVSQSGAGGVELSYTIKVTNNDDATCATASRDFNLTQVQPGGWVAGTFNSASLTVNKNNSQTTTYKLTSPGAVAAGNYQFTIKATDNVDGTKNDSKNGTYTATTCPAGALISTSPASGSIGDTITVNGTNAVNDFSICLYDEAGNLEDEKPGMVGFFESFTFVADSIGTWNGTIELGLFSCPAGGPGGCRDSTVIAAVACSSNGTACSGDGDCCESNCDGGICAPACTTIITCTPTACSGTPGAMTLDVDCVDTGTCAAAPTTTTNSCCGTSADCSVGDTCDTSTAYGTCVPCKGEGEATTNASLCCSGLNLIAGVCTSKCDPSASFFCNPLRESVETLVQGGEKMIGYVLGIIGSVALLLMIISGTMYMTSAGNEERIASSKKILTGSIIGLAISLLSFSLLQLLISIL